MVPQNGGGWSFRLWAPGAAEVALELPLGRVVAAPVGDGIFEADVAGREGEAYRLFVDGRETVDPAARWLQGGVSGPARLSRVTPPAAAPPRDWAEAAILELHVGTFTAEGTFAAAAARLPELARLGITAVEPMPIAAFAGPRGWGYDGVFPYAVHPAYGSPQDFADFVGAAHAAGLLVILDVVYNHFGPEGAVLPGIAPEFFDASRQTPWGAAIDFTLPQVRDFFIGNAVMWVREFGVDGLRLDAVHELRDPSPQHFVADLAEALRAAVPDRPVHLIAEDDRNLPEWRNEGWITANWSDDYHHAVHCLLTGENEAYYTTFAVDPMGDLVRALAEGHVEQGQPRPPRPTLRGAPTDHLPLTAFIHANQTHDQVGNRAMGERLISLADPGQVRIAHAMLLTAPAIPMLFMGEEAGARAPFLFFAGFDGDLGEAVRKGRAAEFEGFASFKGTVPDPLSPETFERSHPYAEEAPDAEEWRDLTRRCLTFRAEHVVPLLKSGRRAPAEVTATGSMSFRATWAFAGGSLHMAASLGAEAEAPAPLLKPAIEIGTPEADLHFAVMVTSE